MKHPWLCFGVVGILVQACAYGQQSGESSDTLSVNSGKIANVYSNECLGFSLPIPAGWEMDTKVVGTDAKAKHIAGGGLTLLYLRPQGKPSGVEIIHLIALDATGQASSVQDYVSRLVHEKAHSLRLEDGTLVQKELIRDASPVDYGGKRFFRAEFKQSVRGDTFYVGFVYTKFRGYFLGEDFVARSPEELDKTADSLLGISFREDERNSRCVEDPTHPGTIRLSEGASQRLLFTKIEPHYPEDAGQAHVEGPVVLKALIGTTGDVEDLTLVSGPELLVPAAMEAVRQWKYKPFLMGSEPVKMETQITVSFQLSEQ